MLRLREHRSNIQSVIRDERISPNRRALLVVLALYFDVDSDPRLHQGKKTEEKNKDLESARRDKDMLYNILVEQWGNPKNIQWIDGADYGMGSDVMDRANLDATAHIRKVMEDALQTREKV